MKKRFDKKNALGIWYDFICSLIIAVIVFVFAAIIFFLITLFAKHNRDTVEYFIRLDLITSLIIFVISFIFSLIVNRGDFFKQESHLEWFLDEDFKTRAYPIRFKAYKIFFDNFIDQDDAKFYAKLSHGCDIGKEKIDIFIERPNKELIFFEQISKEEFEDYYIIC